MTNMNQTPIIHHPLKKNNNKRKKDDGIDLHVSTTTLNLLASESTRSIALLDLTKKVENVGEAAEKDHSSNGVGLVAGFLVGGDTILLKDVSSNLTALARDAADISRKTVHVESAAVLGELHELRSALPVDELLAVLDSALVELLESLLGSSTGTEELDTLLHDRDAGPALGIDDIGVLEGLLHVVGDGELAAGSSSVLLGNLDDLGKKVIALGVSKSDVHAVAGHEGDDGLRHREGLAIRGAVGPAHDELLALQVLDATKVVDEVAEIGGGLSGVILIALQVDDAGLLRKNALFLALLASLGDLELVLVALTKEEIITDADDLSHEGEHGSGLTDSLTVGDLALGLVHIKDREAKQGAGRGEGGASASGLVTEDGHSAVALEHTAAHVLLVQLLKSLSGQDQSIDLLLGVIPSAKEVTSVHIHLLHERLELLKYFFQLVCHFFW